ncbi:MAG: 2-oxoacid:ferredoxin oxidoreductase subunit beta [Alphaproteobacteria bacterium]
MNVVPEQLTAKDFATDQEVRWCPGCGDYAILKALQRTMPEIGATPEKTVFVSGIGCAARFPYYMETYGFHTIHGRAPAFATGIKLSNPDLDIWVVGGDGDMLSIGGNHLLHALRRNVDLQILIFNNEIYGLTKGQYSPTSRIGTRSPSTPQGSVEAPVSAALFALGSGARFVARSVDTDQKHLPVMFKRAHAHRGASLLEIFQNCIVYNDGVFDGFKDPSVAADRQVRVEHGQPMIFGKEKNRGLRLRPGAFEFEAVTIGENGVTAEDIAIHDETNRVMATLLASMDPDTLPVALGVLYCNPAPTYETGVLSQAADVRAKSPNANLNKLLRSGYTWTV